MLLQIILPHQDQTQEVVNNYVGRCKMIKTTVAMYSTSTPLTSALPSRLLSTALSRYSSTSY